MAEINLKYDNGMGQTGRCSSEWEARAASEVVCVLRFLMIYFNLRIYICIPATIHSTDIWLIIFFVVGWNFFLFCLFCRGLVFCSLREWEPFNMTICALTTPHHIIEFRVNKIGIACTQIVVGLPCAHTILQSSGYLMVLGFFRPLHFSHRAEYLFVCNVQHPFVNHTLVHGFF